MPIYGDEFMRNGDDHLRKSESLSWIFVRSTQFAHLRWYKPLSKLFQAFFRSPKNLYTLMREYVWCNFDRDIKKSVQLNC